MTKINLAIIAALIAFAMTLDYQIASANDVIIGCEGEECAYLLESLSEGCTTDSECEGIE